MNSILPWLTAIALFIPLCLGCQRLDVETEEEPAGVKVESGAAAVEEDSEIQKERPIRKGKGARRKGMRRFADEISSGKEPDVESRRYLLSMKKARQNPLVRLPVSAFSLKGTITEPDLKRGIVALPGGEEYVVKIGDFLGRNGGRVVAIEKERIVVSELEVSEDGGEEIVKKYILLEGAVPSSEETTPEPRDLKEMWEGEDL